MSENLLSKIIAEQTEILLKNINSVVQSANLEAEFDGLNASRFIFHTLHSLDKWFVNPAEYKYDENSSGGVAENLSVISSSREDFDAAPGVVIPRENLEKYAVSVAQKIRNYLANLSDKMQVRHVMCHVGISSAINFQNGNGWLKYFGLD